MAGAEHDRAFATLIGGAVTLAGAVIALRHLPGSEALTTANSHAEGTELAWHGVA